MWEESLWAVIYGLGLVSASTLWLFGCDDVRLHPSLFETREFTAKRGEHHHDDLSVTVMRYFIRGMVVFGLGALPYMSIVDVPTYYNDWQANQLAGKVYFSIPAGTVDAMNRRVVSQLYSDWSSQVFWMSGYFSIACMAAVVLMLAPGRVRIENCSCGHHTVHGRIPDKELGMASPA